MYLIEDVLGLPKTFSSTFTHCFGEEVEDNAVTVMGYENGAVAINETSFVANCCPVIFEVCGERGKVFYQKGKGIEPDVIKATLDTGCDFVKVETEDASPAPIELFALGKTADGCGIEDAIKLSVMMDGAYKNIAKA